MPIDFGYLLKFGGMDSSSETAVFSRSKLGSRNGRCDKNALVLGQKCVIQIKKHD